ncbi:hypothetical protein FQN50_002806 [Emmonsiellopsis sp. PD_5]|nr:hypothetical protein FQN50_002806 [Emmonsiellopsis sp. PD_5]
MGFAQWDMLWIFCAASLLTAQHAFAQFASNARKDPDIKVIHSPANSSITISYKSPPAGICTTFSPNQKQYTGYVLLPPSTLSPVQQNYPVSTFFWFIEARENAAEAPLTIYLNGGPGSSSMVGLFQEIGPCEVVETSRDHIGTRAREWGWDRASNLLFIDQPVQSGFSYDVLVNGSLDLLSSTYKFPQTAVPPNQSANTYLNGTFSSHNIDSTTNTTAIAASAVWHMLQGFLNAFPQYYRSKTPPDMAPKIKNTGIHLFTESYGGKYGPAFASFFEKQNVALHSGALNRNNILEINLQSLTIMQGCIDDLVQQPFYPIFAHNNTYDIHAISQAEMDSSLAAFHKPSGCKEQITTCRSTALSLDPDASGVIDSVNFVCLSAMATCKTDMLDPFYKSNRSGFDISQSPLSSFAPLTHLTYLNNKTVQEAIGARTNYTDYSDTVQSAFISTGDYTRTSYVPHLAELLASGIRVALIYGDRDYVCNWMGGEEVSFAVAASLKAPSIYHRAEGGNNTFRNVAGYAPLIVGGPNDSPAGVVRQLANFSFTRLYDAGHFAAAAQPEAMFMLFERILDGSRDLASGKKVDLPSFYTKGPAQATKRNVAPPMKKTRCYVRAVDDTCTEDQKGMLREGRGAIINGVLYESDLEWNWGGNFSGIDSGGQASVGRYRLEVILKKIKGILSGIRA